MRTCIYNYHKMNNIRLVFCVICFCLPSLTYIGAQNLENLSDQKPLQFYGSIALQGGIYQYSGLEARQAPNYWTLTGSPVLEVYGVRLPFSFVLSNQHRTFQQPFNQLGVTPTWKWIKVHAGYSAARFSPFTLAGRRFLGAGAELTPGKWRIGFISGRFQKAVEADPSAAPVPGQFLSEVPVPAFSRYGHAAKLGYGTTKNYLDISFLKAADRVPFSIQDSLVSIRPQSNTVVGVSNRITFFKQLSLQSELAVSAYTRDQNADSISLDAPRLQKLINTFFVPRMSSQLSTAVESHLNYRGKWAGLKLSYRRIDPDFRSMGAYYFQNDVEQYTLSPQLQLFRRKVQLNGSLGIQHNNLNAVKTHTTNRIIGSAHVHLQPAKNWSIQGMYSNFGFSREPSRQLINAPVLDTFRLVQVAQSWSGSGRYSFQVNGLQHQTGLNIQYNATTQIQNNQSISPDTKARSAQAYYTVILPGQQLQVNLNVQHQQIAYPDNRQNTIGMQMSLQKTLAADRLMLGASGGFYLQGSAEQKSGNTTQLGAQASWKQQKWGTLFLQCQYIRNVNANPLNPAQSELFIQSGIAASFGS